MKSCAADTNCLYSAQGELTCSKNNKTKTDIVVAPNTVGKKVIPVQSPQKVEGFALKK